MIQDVPRALAFIEIPAGEKVFPTAAEFRDEQVEPLYDKLHADNGAQPPKYPTEEGPEYFKWFRDNVTTMVSIEVIEQAAKAHGRIEWINMRVPYTDEGETLHLHLVPALKYPTGAFAYHLIKRAESHGIRLVGTLKSGPGMNVLAIYET